MSQKADRQATSLHRCRGSARSLATQCGAAFWRDLVRRSTLGATGERASSRSHRLDGSLVGSANPQRTARKLEQEVLRVRHWLREQSTLGEIWPPAIRREMVARGIAACPSIPTISRILRRRGVLDGRRRVRRPPPLKGWCLADVAERKVELDSFDTIEGLAIRGGSDVTVLTGVSLHGGLTAAWTARAVSAKTVVERLVEHWRAVGLPGYAQFDNDNRFQGPRQHADVVGRVTRLCLSLGVIPVFAPPNETGFQAAIESFNALWQTKVWSRFEHRSLRGLAGRSARYIAASRQRRAARTESAPARRLSKALASRSAKASCGNHRLLAADRRPRAGQHAGPHLQRRSELAPSFGSRRCQPGSQHDSLLRPATARSDASTPVEGGSVHTSSQAISGVTTRL